MPIGNTLLLETESSASASRSFRHPPSKGDRKSMTNSGITYGGLQRRVGHPISCWLGETPFEPGASRTGRDPSVVQPFVIDWTAACRVRSALNAKDRTTLLDFQRRSDFGLG